MKVKILNIIDDKTFKVVSESYKPHKKYGKYLTSYKKFLVHCENSKDLNVGQEVSIKETRPISKTKKWALDIKA
jgi:small subunit ribosomal protein S17